ncbi:MAG: glutamine-hydrolyzing GMP synthase [Clostridia bacterium]|nr:glutamine-hydrolyzing GMP synthase [Clostridia bacterium]
MNNQTVVILDFGGQYKELIARRVRECGVYSVIVPFDTPTEKINEMNPCGIIFTGGPNSAYDAESPKCDERLFNLGVPILGICYGAQLIAFMLGGKVIPCKKSEYGITDCTVDTNSVLFRGLESKQRVLMSHTDMISVLPQGFDNIAATAICPCAAFENGKRKIYGVQFHPEVEHSENGTEMIRKFLFDVCGAVGDYSMENYLEEQIDAVRKQVGKKRILLGLSGGADSSVCAALLSRAVPGQVVCVYIDHGFMRKGESEAIKTIFGARDLDLVLVDASEIFLSKLSGVTDPEKKRKIIGTEFARAFERESSKLGKPEFLAQGTIYPDVVESGKNKSAVIKSHHNVGGLPEDLGFEGVVEPLRYLFKDEVRKIGKLLGLPDELIYRQPFPGPGLAIRVIGEITREKLDILREADAIVREEIGKSKRTKADQYFCVLTDTRSVGVVGDFRTYEYTLAVRAVTTSDFMTCQFARIPYGLLAKLSSRITNEVKGVGRVVYDITGKPPATIEWE